VRVSSFILGASAGAAAAWFLDPNDGARRRNVVRDKSLKFVRKGAAEAQSRAQYAAGQAQGAVQRATPSDRPEAGERLNDQGLKAKVESEIFRGIDVDTGRVAVSVEDAVVYLRGEVPSPEVISQLGDAARRVEGVRDVENMLHGPGEPAPMQQAPGHTA
jgi:osmotically-inducible protein OsmY